MSVFVTVNIALRMFYILNSGIMGLINIFFVVFIPNIWVKSELQPILGLFYPKDQ